MPGSFSRVQSATGTDVQVFDESGTWTKPDGAKRVRVEITGAGTGGGRGQVIQTAGTPSGSGGSGGAGGGRSTGEFGADEVGDEVVVTVADGGAGAAALPGTAIGAVVAGSSPNPTSFGSLLSVGLNTGAEFAGGQAGFGNFNPPTAGSVGASGTVGGGGGGGLNIGVRQPGATPSATVPWSGAQSGPGGTTTGTPPQPGVSGRQGGGGGGGACGNASTPGQSGANGGTPGGGGGGGGASQVGAASGAGGNGGHGRVTITTYF